MKISFYLVVSAGGSVRTLKSKPALAWDEICIKQNLELPDALFKKPSLEATVVIPAEAAMPREIDAEVALNAKNAIEQATGLEVKLTIVSDEQK